MATSTPRNVTLSATDRQDIVRQLMPWARCFTGETTFCEPKADGTLVLQVAITLQTKSQGMTWCDQRHPMWQSREAIELLRLILVLDPTLVCDLQNAEWWSLQIYYQDTTKGHDLDTRVARIRETHSLQVNVACWQILRGSTQQHFEACFTQPIPQEQHNDCATAAVYSTARQTLVSWIQRLHGSDYKASPVRLRFQLSTSVRNGETNLDTEIDYVMRFRQSLCDSACSCSFVVETSFELAEPVLTPSMITQLDRVFTASIPFESVGELTLCPSRITCSDEQLQELLAKIVSKKTQLRIEVNLLEQDALNRRNVLKVAFAHHSVDVVIADEYSSHLSAQGWQDVLVDFLDALLLRPPSLPDVKLHCNCYCTFTAAEASSLFACLAAWKASHSDASCQLRLKRLHIDRFQLGHAMVNTFDCVDTIVLEMSTKDDLTFDHLIDTIAVQISNLRCLHLEGAAVDSMDIFAQHTVLPKLQKLFLYGVKLHDKTSFPRFLAALNGGGRLSGLGKLKLYGRDFLLNPSVANVLDAVLTANRVLYHVGLTVPNPEDEATLQMTRLLMKHHGDVVFAPRKARCSKRTTTQRCAFLSVVHASSRSAMGQMDALVVQTVLDYSAPHTKRVVETLP